MDSTELEWRVWIQEAFRDKSSGFSKCLVGQQDLARKFPRKEVIGPRFERQWWRRSERGRNDMTFARTNF